MTVVPSSQSVEVTLNVTFTTIVLGVGPFVYQWIHNGIVISGETGETLMITDVMENHTGHYECIVTTQFGFSNVSNAVVFTVTSELALVQ